MTFDVVIGDRVRAVSVVRAGHLLRIEVDGRTHAVDARRIGAAALSLLVQVEGDSAPTRSVDAAFAARNGNGELDVHLGERVIPVRIRPAGMAGARPGARDAGGATAGPGKIVAPMPGKVVRVLVKAGDAVTARQGLVVVEAMKMENELRAPRDGRVRDVAVVEGQSVDAGAVLIVVE
jgi:biotin carboxyl carrier protein